MVSLRRPKNQKPISKKGWALRIGLGLFAVLLIIVADAVLRLYVINGKPLPPPTEKFITASPVNFSQVIAFSKYRSCQGHDFTGKGPEGIIERNRSMKHYLAPREDLTEQLGVIEIKSPADGRIVFDLNEGTGNQLIIEPDGKPEWGIILFHVDRLPGIRSGTKVKAGQLLGYANVKGRHDFDLALTKTDGTLLVERLANIFRGSPHLPLPWGDYYVSAFDYMTNDVLAEFKAAGFDISDVKYSREYRDQNFCDFDKSHQYKDDWVYIPGTEPQTGAPQSGQQLPPAELYPPTN